jgi:hypothetical protein
MRKLEFGGMERVAGPRRQIFGASNVTWTVEQLWLPESCLSAQINEKPGLAHALTAAKWLALSK